MTERSVAHGLFTVERTYNAAPPRVFAAWADPKLNGKWYGDPNKESVADVFEFRVGGQELPRSSAVGSATPSTRRQWLMDQLGEELARQAAE